LFSENDVDELVVVDELAVDELRLVVEEINVLVITVLNKHGTIVLTEKSNLFELFNIKILIRNFLKVKFYEIT
jgi:hypothetical protein